MDRLDKLDLQLLALLQDNNLQTADQLSEHVGRSPSAIARRLRRLRRTGAVTADVAIISDEAAGQPLFAVVQIQLERHEQQAADLLRRRLMGSPNVQLCLEISGTFDMLLLVVAADMEAYNRFADSLLMDQAVVRRFESTFVKKRVKVSLAVPLEGAWQG